MRTKNAVLLTLVLALVLGMAVVASGATIPALRASPTAVAYPHSARLMSTVTTPSVVVRRLAGASEWTTFAVVVSGDATTTVKKPTSSAAYKVISDGVESDPGTITVAAQLSKPQVNSRGNKGHKLTIKGWVAPAHAGGTVQLTFFRWDKVGSTVVTTGKGKSRTIAKYQWVQHDGRVDVSLARQNSQRSKWSYKWTPSAKGTWKIVVSHEDVAHVYSSASARTVINR